MARPNSSVVVFVLAAAALSAACSDLIAPKGPSIEVLSRPVGDTIGTPAHDSLVVRISQAGGSPAAGVSVRFSATRDESGDNTKPLGYVRVGGRDLGSAEVMTDVSGRASVLVGVDVRKAGPTYFRIEVPALSLSRTDTLMTLPGKPVLITGVPDVAYTVVGGARALTIVLRDRLYNPVEAPTFCATRTGAATVRDGCTIAGQRIGDDTVVVTSATLSARGPVQVLPAGTIAQGGYERYGYRWSTKISAFDGSGQTVIVNSTWPNWAPAGDSLVLMRRDSASLSGPFHVWVVDRTGKGRALIPALANSFGESDPVFSADGSWIYFTANRASGGAELWRARRDGSGATLLATPEANLTFRAPSPSPDGTRVAFRAEPRNYPYSAEIRILDLNTRAITKLTDAQGAPGSFEDSTSPGPAWSPTGEWIAFGFPTGSSYDGYPFGVVRLIRPDGSETRTLTIGSGMICWSPDGTYLGGIGGLVDMRTGAVIRSFNSIGDHCSLTR